MTDSTDVMNSARGNAPSPHTKAELQPPCPTNGNDNEAQDSKAKVQATEPTTVSKEGPSDGAFGHDATSQAIESEASGPAEDLGIANHTTDAKTEACEAQGDKYGHDASISAKEHVEAAKLAADAKSEPFEPSEHISGSNLGAVLEEHIEPATPHVVSSMTKSGPDDKQESRDGNDKTKTPLLGNDGARSDRSFLLDENDGGSASGTEEEQSTFMKELENFFRERNVEFKPPRFYGEEVNCLKLWRTVMRLGGFDKVTSCKMWRHVGDSFKPPKTCTTVSWTFRGFYEKALLDYERHKACAGELNQHAVSQSEPMDVDNQASGSGRARRDAAARAMQGWHSSRQLGSGEVSDPTLKDPSSLSLQKRGKQVKGLLKRKKPANAEDAIKPGRIKASKLLDIEVADIGTPAEWVKITVQETKDCFEVYALVPGLLREEVRVQSDPAGRLVISGEPQNPDNPWGVKPFKKIVSLPSKIDPHLTSAVVTLHGQLFVRAPFAHLSS